jgi:hypothetical protein
MSALQQQVNQWFTDNPNATGKDVVSVIQGAGGLDAHAGLTDILASRYGVAPNEITNYYNTYATPTPAQVNSGIASLASTPTAAQVANTPGMGAQGVGVGAAAQPAYFQQNPDVAAAFQQNSYGLTPEQFAATHYQKYGVNEQRAAPAATAAPTAAQIANTPGMGMQGIGVANATIPGATNNLLPAVIAPPTYEGITAASTPDEIARAYYKFTGEAGGDTTANQDTARTFLESLGIATPTITEAYKDYNELAGLKSSFGVKDGQTAPTQEGILSGFKYANDSGISEKDMEQVLGKDVFNTYKTGFADYAKTGIANILADNQLSFDEARTAVKFGRDYGYDSQKLADLTGTKKEVFDTIYKNYDDTTNKIVDGVLGAEDVKTNDDKIIRALALQDKFGFTDDDLAKAADFTPAQVKEFLDPVRNFGTDLNKILSNTDSTLADTKKFLEAAKTNGAINQLYGTKLGPLDAKITEMEDRWRGFEGVEPMHAQRVYDQIGQQREKLGDQYYRGVFGDPLVMAATLAKKGIDTLADIGQKDKFEATPAEKIFLAKDGTRVFDLGDGTFGVPDAEGGVTFTVPKSQVKTTYGYTEYEPSPDGESQIARFVPLSDKDVDKDGNYQKLMGKVAIDKDTGKEIADLDGKIAQQSSSGGLRKKSNSLNIAFTKDGVPVLTASSQRAGLGALVQDLMPMISMALPFILPGVGSALSSMLPGAGVAASGATAAIAPTLMNQALTQGILSGGLTTLGGGQFEKGFLGGAVSPVINAGVSNFLPNISTDMSRMITNVGTGAVRGALQGGEFKDLLAGGITSGLADYGVNTALGASGLTPQQLNFVTGIAAPLLQGDKINPVTAFGTLVNAGQQTQRARP